MQMNCQTNGSENSTASNHISANVANGSKTGENSDEESDAQVSIYPCLHLICSTGINACVQLHICIPA